MNSTCLDSPYCSKTFSSIRIFSPKFQKHPKHCQKHSATSRNENAVQLRKHSVEIVENIMHMELENDVKLHLKTFAPKNSSQIHLLSRLHQVQMNFTENEVLLQRGVLKQHHPQINESPCFCIQIQMSPPSFCRRVCSSRSWNATDDCGGAAGQGQVRTSWRRAWDRTLGE